MRENHGVLAGTGILLVTLLLLALPVSAAENVSADLPFGGGGTCNALQTGTCGRVENTCIYLFYGQGCPHCERVKPLINDLAVKYPPVQLKTYEV